MPTFDDCDIRWTRKQIGLLDVGTEMVYLSARAHIDEITHRGLTHKGDAVVVVRMSCDERPPVTLKLRSDEAVWLAMLPEHYAALSDARREWVDRIAIRISPSMWHGRHRKKDTRWG